MNTTPKDSGQASESSLAHDNHNNLRALLDTLRAMAQEGLSYSQNEYDTARYKKLLELAAAEYETIIGIPKEEVKALFLKEQGSITPKIGVDSAVVNQKGQVLVLKRGDGTWGMPGGWADIGESPFETAERETFEETGLSVNPVGYIAVTHKSPKLYPGFASQVNICVAVEPVSVDKKVTLSHEHSDYMWIDSIDQVTEWHTGQKRLFPQIFSAYRDKTFIPNID
jgi:8-oxo-dGTP pyrophosphatase MutT (NUDIX family)